MNDSIAPSNQITQDSERVFGVFGALMLGSYDTIGQISNVIIKVRSIVNVNISVLDLPQLLDTVVIVISAQTGNSPVKSGHTLHCQLVHPIV